MEDLMLALLCKILLVFLNIKYKYKRRENMDSPQFTYYYNKLNDDKTELMTFTSKHHRHMSQNKSITKGNSVVSAKNQVKTLGLIFDSLLTMQSHVN